MVHRAHALCLLSRALWFDAAADDAHVGALVASQLPLDALPPPPSARPEGVTAAQLKQARVRGGLPAAFVLLARMRAQPWLSCVLTPPRCHSLLCAFLSQLVTRFSSTFTLRPPSDARAPWPPRGADAPPPGAAGALAALTRALSRRSGSAEEVAGTTTKTCHACTWLPCVCRELTRPFFPVCAGLFVCMCRALGIPARSSHALSPAPLKPDGPSLDASAGLGPDPAHWWRHNYIRGADAPRRRVNAMLRAAGTHAAAAAAQPTPRRAPAQPRARSAAAPNAGGAGAGAGGAATPMCIDLTGDSSDDADDGRGVDAAHAARSKQGAAAAPPAPMPPPAARRRDAELERDTAAALAASASALEDEQPPAAPQSASQRRGGARNGASGASAGVSRAAATPSGRSAATRNLAGSASAAGAAPVAAAGAGAKTFSASRGVVRHWAEVYIGTTAHGGGAWAAVLPWDRSAAGAEAIARCEAGATACSGGAAAAAASVLSYVVACVGGGAKDVTQRYASRWSACQKARTDDAWWDAALAPLRRREAAASAHALALSAGAAPRTDADADAAVAAAAAAAAAEDAAMAAAAGAEALPTRISDYKAHPLYALARHLTRYQTIHPPVRVGVLGRESVFRRDAVRELHTADVWQRAHGRRVREEARATPAKRVERRGAAAAAKRAGGAAGMPSDDIMDMGGGMFAEDGEPDDDEGGAGGGNGAQDEAGDACGGPSDADEDAADADAKESLALHGRGPVCLYGEWQTEAHEAAAAVDGRVPRNSFGNVDLLRGAKVPRGCVHVALPRAAQTARQLGIDAPPALVGFDRYAGRQVPVLDGVVVAEEHAETLVNACLAEETARAERAEARKAAEAAARWRQLLAAIWTRARLEATYGGGAAGGAGAGAGGASSAGRATHARRAAAEAEPEIVILDDEGDIAPSPQLPPPQQQPAQPAVEGGVAKRLCAGGFKVEVEEM
jgi:xeroderma pigmentosum group C-complementing protein